MSERTSPFARPLPILVLVAAAILLDQASKIAVEQLLPQEVGVPVLPFLAFYRTYNLGVAFSMLSDADGWFIVGMRLAIVGFVLWLWRRTPPDRLFAHPGYALIIAGAAGNLIDRFLYGHVVDFILFHTPAWSFAVFNLADSFITIGAGLVILDELVGKKSTDR
ncbi:signal peptidase II [Gellertiella hungarica]|uniref:Lipoprotein signal peptidase n=1 Tax=Gellertiella hungarica TaxID=1572859 RepID=A0A7W6J2Z5_9HYPH|nr:signal peptidase II [Gellertiella hungarica]MBB4063793.1 signal peptidase II [Gellertiella hungarica]